MNEYGWIWTSKPHHNSVRNSKLKKPGSFKIQSINYVLALSVYYFWHCYDRACLFIFIHTRSKIFIMSIGSFNRDIHSSLTGTCSNAAPASSMKLKKKNGNTWGKSDATFFFCFQNFQFFLVFVEILFQDEFNSKKCYCLLYCLKVTNQISKTWKKCFSQISVHVQKLCF